MSVVRFYATAFLATTLGSVAAVPLDDLRTRGLGADDACSQDQASASSCAVSALQRASARGGVVSVPNDAAPKEATAKLGSTATSEDGWVWSKQIADADIGLDRFHDDPFWTEFASVFAPKAVSGCMEYNAYYWPQATFWSLEVLRRVRAVPDDAAPAKLEELQAFTRNASFLMCNFWFDPRAGTNWSKPVADYMNEVRSRPDSDLSFPRLTGFFELPEVRNHMFSVGSCLFWAESLMCDLGAVAEESVGDKVKSDELCWDTVPAPDYGFTLYNLSMQPGRESMAPDTDVYSHPEYNGCLSKPFSKDLIGPYCPMFGHYPDNYLNLSSWGTPFPAGSKQREEVFSCERKLNIPAGVKSDPRNRHWPWATDVGGVNLMSSPPDDWVPDSIADTSDPSQLMTVITEAARDVSVMTPECDKTDWMCVLKSLSAQLQEDQAAQKPKLPVPDREPSVPTNSTN